MKLRIIAGTLKGRMIAIPEKDTAFRPTRDRIRESVASILAPVVHSAVVGDLCAGSGTFGFEMISRGARKALFVEHDRNRCKLIGQHAQKFGVAPQCTVIESSIAAFIGSRRLELFDILYYDPPYDSTELAALLPSLLKLISPRGILVFERRSGSGVSPLQSPNPSVDVDIRTYGETEICIFRNQQAAAIS